MTPEDVIHFWLEEIGPSRWFVKDSALDQLITDRFVETYRAAAAGALDAWAETADGALALVLVLDQFPRNMFRDTPEAFATDALARQVADVAMAAGQDRAFPSALRCFFYLPLEHSESLEDQQRCLTLMATLEDRPDLLGWAVGHHQIIERFGRFPHRNAILGRLSTAEELAFLAEPGSRF